MRPLDSLPSLKLKLSIVIVAAVLLTAALSTVGVWFDWPVWIRPVIAAGLSLVMVHFLAKGTTYPLRQMAHAVEAMAAGDYEQRVETASVDEVGQLARSFNSMVHELAEVQRQREELVANVSHELRTPIAAVQMNLENLVDGVTEWDTGRGEVMLRQTQRLSRLVAQLLDLARFEAHAVPLRPRTFVVRDLLAAVAAEADLGDHGASVSIEAPAAMEIVGDPERLHQLVANLVDNAIRHSPEGSAVEVIAEERDGGARIVVADRGPGIPFEERERVFERFHRVDAGRSTQRGGSGLGLAIARWIVDLHGGAVRAEANAPTGCAMVIDLPTLQPT